MNTMSFGKRLIKILSYLLGIGLIIAGINAFFAFVEERIHTSNVPEDGKIYTWKYGKIFYTKKGKGSPVIVIHSLDPDHSGKNLLSLTHHLSLTHCVYTIDLLGFGLSDKPWITYTNFLYVTLIKNFAKDVIGEKASIVACGDSCLFALQANKLEDSMFEKIVLLNPAHQEKLHLKKEVAMAFKNILDFPLFGTFIYNMYSLVSGAPFAKEGRHVTASRLAGHLSVSIDKRPGFIRSNVAILEKKADKNFTYGDILSALDSEQF